MRLAVVLTVVWYPCVLLVSPQADSPEPARTPASAAMASGSPAKSSGWDEVTEQEWRVQELDRAPVLEGTEITIVFDRHGKISGNASTNRYTGAYQRTGTDGLVVSDLGTTRMYLDFPPGRMRQEARYLDDLQSVKRFTLVNDELSLWLDGDRSIRYVRSQ